MCLHGFDQSGQEHSVRSSPRWAGKSDTPARVKASSTSSGISEASSFAANRASRHSDRPTLRHAAGESVSTPIVTA